MSKLKKKFVWNGVTYPSRSEWMKAVRADPDREAKRKQSLRRAWQGKKGEHRRQWISKRQHEYMLALPKKEQKRLQELRSAGASRELTKLWANNKWRAKQIASRNNPAKQAERSSHARKGASSIWDDPIKAAAMRKERRDRWKNPEFRAKMLGVWTTKGTTSWNSGHTKETHPGVQHISDSLIGKIPQQTRMIWLYRKNALCIPMKSSYELLFARWCDERGIKWQYEPRWFNVGKGDWRGISYTPDFYLPILNTYIEVKGYFSEENKRKMQAFYKNFPTTNLYLLKYKALQALRVLREHIPHRKSLFQHIGIYRMVT